MVVAEKALGSIPHSYFIITVRGKWLARGQLIERSRVPLIIIKNDLKFGRRNRSEKTIFVDGTMLNEHWPNCLLSTDRTRAQQRVPEVRISLQRRSLREEFFLLGSILIDGVCTTNLPRKLA